MPQHMPYIDKELNKAIYPWLRDRKDNNVLRSYQIKPEEEIRFLLTTRLISEYGYNPQQIDLEVEIKSGQTTLAKRADIIVFGDVKAKAPEANAYIICEVKSKDRKEGLDQLETYINNTTAEYGIWWNGNDIIYLRRLKEPHRFDEIPDVPRKGETLEDVGTWSKEKLVIATDLIKVFDTIHNHIYANEGFLKEKVFNEMLKFIFMKMIDEKLSDPKPYFRITSKELEAIREGKEENFTDRIQYLWTKVKKEYGDVFNQEERINLRADTQAFVTSQLQRFDFRRTPSDIKGTAFQTFVYAHQRGERGEFFTPHPIVELMVNMLDPSDHEAILDPACGSGGLLVRAMQDVWSKIDKVKHLNELDKRERKYTYARYYVRGIDFNPDLARVSKMHMVVFEDGHTGIFCTNSLYELDAIKEDAIRHGAIREGEEIKNGFEIVLTNPPFGTKGRITDKRILQQFDLGFIWRRDRTADKWYKTDKLQDGQTPEILFIERCLQFLKPNGRMAIVLPDGILSNSSLGYVRQWILDNTKIIASVSLPPETFIPYGSGIKASVLFLQKLNSDELSQVKLDGYNIFFAIVNKIGYDVRGRETHRRDEQGQIVLVDGKPVVDSDISEVITSFKAFIKEN
jgi:type I restriction enzyme M protein